MLLFDKITFHHSIFNMDQSVERMHKTQYKFHTQTTMTTKFYSTVYRWSTCPPRYISDVVTMTMTKKIIAKVVQRKTLQNAVHDIHIITDKPKKTYWRINFDNGGRSRTYVPQIHQRQVSWNRVLYAGCIVIEMQCAGCLQFGRWQLINEM